MAFFVHILVTDRETNKWTSLLHKTGFAIASSSLIIVFPVKQLQINKITNLQLCNKQISKLQSYKCSWPSRNLENVN